jgi:hypothetical protein
MCGHSFITIEKNKTKSKSNKKEGAAGLDPTYYLHEQTQTDTGGHILGPWSFMKMVVSRLASTSHVQFASEQR